MENLKIRVTTEQESKEAQELFFELGYYWAYRKIGKKFYYKDGDVFIFAESDGILGAGVIKHAYFFNSHKAKEITLPQLRDMVKPKVKEYLTKNSSGNYQLVNHRFNGDDIEVPEGAEILTAILGDEVFYKSGEPWEWYCEESKKWMECSDIVGLDGFQDILWHRKKESLNDKVASAEVARQEFKSADNVNHPKHYTSDPSGIECIEIIRHRNFNIGNAIKYLWRNGLKDSDSQIQDLEKAIWYIQDEINRLSK